MRNIRGTTARVVRWSQAAYRAIWRRTSAIDGDGGMATAEYAVGIIAAVAFAGLLLKVLTSSGVQQALSDIVARALSS